ncbi:MAG TPA: amino acid permease [Solirubrobacteraceae bacterium]|nr:amino acid permease [Solirubrobacteraceae bacterium]
MSAAGPSAGAAQAPLQAAAAQPPGGSRRRVMGLRDITLYTVSAVLVVETLTSSAAVGTKTLAWWLLFLILFYMPYGLITAELATAYPEQGGIYVWVRRAFGRRAAARTTYWYWVNVAMWMPSVFLVFAGVFCQLFIERWSEWPAGKWPQVVIALALTWLVVAVGMIRLDVGKHFNNIGAALKMVIIVALGAGGIVFAIRHGAANSITGSSFVPSFDVAKRFLPVIIYLMIGFELVSSMGDELEQPQKRIPRALLTSGLSIAFFYVLATVGILLALSLSKLHLIEGLVETFKAIFGRSGAGEVVVYALGVAALYTFFANMTTWTMGANRAAAEAAKDGELPAPLGREHPVRRTPVAAFAISGVISSAILLITAVFINTQDNLFFAIFASSSVIFLMPYLLMFPAAVALRYKDPDRPRPFQVPGGKPVLIALATVTSVIVAGGILLFVWPEVPSSPTEWSYTGPLLGIVVAALAVGEAIVWAMFRPHEPGVGVFHRGHPHARPHLRHRYTPRPAQPDPSGAPAPLPPGSEPFASRGPESPAAAPPLPMGSEPFAGSGQ